MGFTNRVGIVYHLSLTVVLCLWLCGSNGAESGFKIFRGEQDIFTKVECNPGSERCNDDQCKSYGAECVDTKCKFCRCMNGKSTFMINQDGGVCKSDEEIVPESVPNVAFWLKNNEYDKCLKLESSSSNYIIGTNCTAWPTVDMLWIQINANNKRLMNVKTLKCMKRSTNNKKVTINQCEKANTNWQRIRCTDNRDGMEIRWNVGSKRRYLRLPNSAADGDAYAISSSNGNQQWRSKQGTTCVTSTAYKGCYRFSDGSFMKYLNYNETKPKLRISAPIFKENDGSCYVWNKFKFIQNGQEWKDRRDNLFYIKDDTKELKIRSMENLIPLNGSLLKLTASCKKGTSKETYCVLLKLESLPPYSEVIKRTPSPSPKIISTGKVTTAFSKLSPTSVTSKNPQKGAREEESESGGTNAAVIAITVTLLLVALAIALGYLVYYRRRKKRAEGQQTNNNDIGTVNYSKEIYEDPDRIYETLKEDGDEVPQYQPGTSSDIYSNPDSNIVSIPASTEQDYTYANDTDLPRSRVGTKPTTKEPIRNGAVYETLEQPGQMTDDDFYNYPDNTNIANPGSSELEYIYAKDTDLPRATANTKAVRERDIEPATCGGLYHTLEQEGPASTEQEYSYAKNTDMPSIFRNHQVTDEIPNCSDHTYIDVIEDSSNTDSRKADNSSTTA